MPNRLFEVNVAGAEADSNFLDGLLCLLLEAEFLFEMGNFSQTAIFGVILDPVILNWFYFFKA